MMGIEIYAEISVFMAYESKIVILRVAGLLFVVCALHWNDFKKK